MWFTIIFYSFIAYFWAENLIYVDHFIEFYNIWHECLYLKKIENKNFQLFFKGYVFFAVLAKKLILMSLKSIQFDLNRFLRPSNWSKMFKKDQFKSI